MKYESDDVAFQLFTVSEAAARLRISKSLLYQLVESGKITACRLGHGKGAIRIAMEDLIRYVESRRVVTGEATVRPPHRREHLRHLTV